MRYRALVILMWGLAGTAWGQPADPAVKWVFEAQSNLYAPPLVADVHPAPGLETILGDSEAKRLLCLDARGAVLWEYRGGWKKRLISAAALRPARGDQPAALAVANADGRLCCVDAQSGREFWQREVGAVEWGGALWADLDADGAPEIVVGTDNQGIIALNADGATRWTYRGPEGAGPPNVRAPLAAADIDRDGRAEVFGCGAYGLFCLNPDGALRWETITGDDFTGSPVVADADRDGRAEVYAASANDAALWSLDADTGAIRWTEAMLSGTDAYPGSALAVGDLDQDGRAEIVSGGTKGQLHAYAADGALLWVYAIAKPAHLCASLGDVDGDGRIETLAASGDHYLYCLDERGGLKWKFGTELRLVHPPTLADIDQDGLTEILVCGSDHQLRCLTLGGRYQPGLIPWPSRRFDAAQSGASFGVEPAPLAARVLVSRSLFAFGDFEQDKTVDAMSPYPKESEILKRRQQVPRGWRTGGSGGDWGLDGAAAFSGKFSLRVANGLEVSTALIPLEAGLRTVLVMVRAQGSPGKPPEIEWVGSEGRVAVTAIEPGPDGASPPWREYRAEALTPPRAARWMRLSLTAPRYAESWFDGIEITGSFDEPRTVRPLVNQVGYDLGSPKTFVVQSNWKGERAEFVLLREDGVEAFHGTLEPKGRIQGHFGQDWGFEYWQGDFSAFEEAGRYRIRVTMDGVEDTSWPIEIGGNVLWSRTSRPAYRFFYYQRCGIEIPGFHGACHLDDAAGADGKAQYELWGGWHDAGDYNKYHNAPYVWGLARAYGCAEAGFRAQDEDGNGSSDFFDEIVWGGEHLRRMVAPDGSAYGPITSGYGYWGPPELETDNIPGTGDERRLSGQDTGADPGQHHAALARIAVYALDPQPWIEPAARGLAWAVQHGQRGLLQFSTATDLFAVTRNPPYATLAKETFPAISAAADVVDAVRRYDAVFGEDHREALRTALVARAEEMLPLAANPFGVYTFGPVDRPNFFGTHADQGGWHVGTSSYLLEAANLVALAYQYEPDPRFLRFVYDQFNWTLGVNPFDISLMEGQGSAFPPSYHQRLTFGGVPRGAIPGSVVNGITWRGPGDDRPFFDMSGVDIPAFEPNEVWLPHNTAYVNAVANLHAARKAAGGK
jgi:endoglucanase